MDYHEDRRQDEVPVCNFCKFVIPKVCNSGINCNCECHNYGIDAVSTKNPAYVNNDVYDADDYLADHWEFPPIEGTHLCHVENVCSICGKREIYS